MMQDERANIPVETPANRAGRRPGSASRLYRSLADRFAALLIRELGDRLTAIVLFGSVARGTARPESDIDLLVIAGETDAERRAVQQRIGDADLDFWNGPEVAALRERGYGANIETLVLSKPQALRGTPIYLDMSLEAVILHDPAGFFARRIAQVRRRMAELGSYREELSRGQVLWRLKAGAQPGDVFSLPYVEEVEHDQQ